MNDVKCKDDYIKTSNKIRRKTISLANKLFNNHNNIKYIMENHLNELQTLDNIFYVLEDKINYLQKLIKEHKKYSETEEIIPNKTFKNQDINKLLPIFYYWMFINNNNNNYDDNTFDIETGINEVD